MLLLWPGEVRRKREGDFGQIGLALLAGTNNCPSFINKISSTSYCHLNSDSCRGRTLRHFGVIVVLCTTRVVQRTTMTSL